MVFSFSISYFFFIITVRLMVFSHLQICFSSLVRVDRAGLNIGGVFSTVNLKTNQGVDVKGVFTFALVVQLK